MDGDLKNKKKKEKKVKEPAVSVIKLLRFASKADMLLIIIGCIGSIGIGALQPVAIIVLGQFLDDLGSVLSGTSEEMLNKSMDMILVFVYMGTAVLVASYTTHAFWVIAGESQAKRIRQLYVHSILRQDMTWFDKAQDGSLTTRLATDTQMIQEGISEKLGSTVQMISQIIASFVVAFVKGWQVAVVILATIPLMAVIGGLMEHFYTKYTKIAQDSYAQAGSVVEQAFSGIRTIYAFSLQDRFAKRYEVELKKACVTGSRRGTMLGVQMGAIMLILFGSWGITFWYGSKLVDEGKITSGTVVIAFFAMFLGMMSLFNLPMNLSAISSACGAAYHIFAIIDRVPEIDTDSSEGIKDKKLSGQVEFRNVDFAYPTRPDIQVLKNFSVEIEPGMTVALVGSSGSGKSTVVQLLQRFYDTLGGDVLIDGKSIKDYNVQWLRGQIGVVSQEPVLFNMTIRKNLLMGAAHHVTDEEMVEACKKANCHAFISQLPKGYDTMVGQQGSMLSGGQKQRIAIARAIIKNPSILLLDEATSALDTRSERVVQRALDVASEDRTTLVIAHRLSTIRNADMIIVMTQGEIIERGNHNELVEKGGLYADLVRKQLIATEQEDGDSDSTQDDHIPVGDDDSIFDEKDQLSINVLTKRPSIASSIELVNTERKRELAVESKFKHNKIPLLRVLHQMRPEWPLIAIGAVGGALAGCVFPIANFLIGLLITYMMDPTAELQTGPMAGANLYSFIFLILAIIAFIGQSAQMAGFEVAGERYTSRLRGKLFRKLMKQEVAYYDDEENSTGALTSMLALDAKNINELITKIVGEIANMISLAITGFIIAFVYSWILTLIMFALLPFLILGSAYETKVEMDYEDDTKKAGIQSGEVASEAIKTIRTVASLAKQSYFEDKYEKACERPHRLARRKAYLASLGFAINQGMLMYTYAVAFYAGIRLMGIGKITLEEMMVTLMTLIMTANGIGRSVALTSGIAKAKYAALAVFEILNRQSKIDPDLEGIEPATVKGDVSCKNVSFRYPARADVPIFSGGFNFTGMAGKTVALVGSSGCGKSTTIALLERWYDVDQGTVHVDEQNVQSFSLNNLRSHIGLVSQEPVLFDMTVEENVRFGVGEDMNVTQEQIEQACRAANIHKFISELPQGYDTRVGDKGSQLSGGQKQRIAIARALLRKPKVLLLDEATSALDSESEKLVQTAIDNIVSEGGRTTITIAHRLSTIQNADIICVIDKGKIVEQGTHWELLRLDGLYSTLVREQSLTTV
ncbi:P-loop containing nucleoside triphosphate hydrolase protein [Fennellomyces sp. T-0311]|nr:P-loop containing nucleoside triphosphate hydrolase protein [Fennellomyces sp. T-0311]